MKKGAFYQILITTVITFAISFVIAIPIFLFAGRGQKSAADSSSKPLPNLTQSLEQTNISPKQTTIPTEDFLRLTEDEQNSIAIYNKLNAAVVNITTEILAYNFFLEAIPQSGGSGSGSIIDKEGIILTNTHVVENAYKVYVNLSDGSQYEGKVIGKDPENDLAVVKIDPKGKPLTTIPFGSSENLMIGQKVLAIGNPFGYDRTLTTGIVSGLARPVRSSSNSIIQNMIQTDASINPGNSGGPLINSLGQMIGINTMIYSPTGASVGIGFAVPVDTAKRVVPDLIQYGSVNRGWLDITPVQLNSSIANYAGLSVSRGLLVSEVEKGGLAEKAGIRGGETAVRYGRNIIYLGGDIITNIDGQVVNGYADMLSALEDNKPGERVKVGIIRKGQKEVLEVELGSRHE